MSLAALAKQLADIGTPIEGIILALEAVEARDRAAAEKREQAAERKRRQRERERDCHGTVTGHGEDSTPPLDKSPQTPKINPHPAHTREGRATARGWACPEGVEPQHWSDFLDNRRRKKLGFNETGYAHQIGLIAKFADDEWPPGRLVERSAAKGWGTIVDPHESDGQTRNGNHHHRTAAPAPDEPSNPLVAAALRRSREAGDGFPAGDWSAPGYAAGTG
jgi:hypothetical protein